VCAVLPRILPGHLVTRYLLPLSRLLSYPIKAITGVFPFALLELAVITLPFLTVGIMIAGFMQRKNRRETMYRSQDMHPIALTAVTVALMMSFFHLLHGIGFHTMGLNEHLKLAETPVDANTLRSTADILISQASAVRAHADHEWKGISSYSKTIRHAYSELAQSYPVYSGYSARAKKAILSVPMSYLGIGGLYSPFTCEAIINADATAPSLPFTVAHEIAHSLRVARENEANFSAYLACVTSDDPAVQYSGYFTALLYLLPALRRSEPENYADYYTAIDEGIRKDIAEYVTHVQQYDGWLNDLHSDINDFFLKSNGQSAGVLSYGLMVNLLVAWHASGNE